MRSISAEISAYNIQLSPDETPGRTHVHSLTQDSADKTSELLMVNHVRYHTLFDAVGFHSKSYTSPVMTKCLSESRRPHRPPSFDAVGAGGDAD